MKSSEIEGGDRIFVGLQSPQMAVLKRQHRGSMRLIEGQRTKSFPVGRRQGHVGNLRENHAGEH